MAGMVRFLLTGGLVCGLLAPAAAFEEELRFAAGLAAEGFPRLAQTVLSRTLRAFPAAEEFAPELRIRILIAGKKFDDAQAQIAGAANPAALWLFLAETAGRAHQADVAESAYQKYFAASPDPDEESLKAAFQYGGLLEARGERRVAAKLYEQVLKSAGTRPEARPVMMRLAQLLLSEETPDSAGLERAKKLCEQVQLGGLDLWFGQAVVGWSRVMQLQGEGSESRPVLETQLALLRQIEEALRQQGHPVSSFSPLAGARFLLGACYEQEDRKPEALHQFYNVYAKYGDSPWGPEARVRAEALMDFFRAQGRTVRINPGANRAGLEENAFRVARRLFAEKDYAGAVPAYLEALQEWPEGGEAPGALRDLMLGCIYLRDGLSAKTVAACIAERFAAREGAAEALLAAGRCAREEHQGRLSDWLYGLYFERFPRHGRVPDVLCSLAALRRQEGDRSGEETLLRRAAEHAPGTPAALRALSRQAWNAFEREEYAAAAETFGKAAELEPGLEEGIRLRFARAEAYRLSENRDQALAQYRALEEFLTEAAGGFGAPEELLIFSRPFHEKAIFYQGDCLVKTGQPGEAVRTLDRFAALFPESEILPQVRFAAGSARMELKEYAAALAEFAHFDETAERKFLEPVLYFRGEALRATGRFEESVGTLDLLFSSWPETPLFFEARLTQGCALSAAGRFAEAVSALSDALGAAVTEEQAQRAGLALGRAQRDPSEKLASFQRVALLADPHDPVQAPLIAQALCESLPLYLELNRPQDLLADSERLLSEFPEFGREEEIEAMRRAVRQQVTQHEKSSNFGKEMSNAIP
jgi:tetratricopeptide (TPR) repeat protein